MFSETILVAIVTALVALLSIWLTNRHNLKQQRQQFKFDKEERQQERRVALRRDVYLAAAEALVEANSAFAKLISTESVDKEVDASLKVFGTAISRVQMVSTSETYKLLAELHRAYLKTFLALNIRRFPLLALQNSINSARKLVDNREADVDKALESLTAYNRAQKTDPKEWERLSQQYDIADTAWHEAFKQLNVHSTELLAKRIDVLRDYLSRIAGLSALQAPALSAIRDELESESARELIVSEAQETAVVMTAAIDAMIEILEAQLNATRRDDDDKGAVN